MDYNSSIDLLAALPALRQARFQHYIIRLIRTYLAIDPKEQMRHVCKIIEFAYPFSLKERAPAKWIEKHYLYCPCMGIVDQCEEKMFNRKVGVTLPPIEMLEVGRDGALMPNPKIHTGFVEVGSLYYQAMMDGDLWFKLYTQKYKYEKLKEQRKKELA